ncbi:MAG: calcium/sodium antiporter [Patescibacteria group bacterium]|nr:calcium/sodium antiporter [Patescibacteria group bacterium]
MTVILFLTFIAGFIFLLKGASLLISGSSSLAKRFGVSDFFIGITFVTFGVSIPELVVNITAAVKGSFDIGIGNILGSNIANILLVLGISALIAPIIVKLEAVKREIPLSLLALVILWLLVSDGMLSNFDGLILLILFFAFFVHILNIKKEDVKLEKISSVNVHPLHHSILMVLIGFAGLFFGSKWLLDGAIEIARFLRVSEAAIGFTIVAIGTTLPDLTASIVAVYKKKLDIAVGIIMGANIFKVLFIIGLIGIISAFPVSKLILNGIMFTIFVTLLFFASIFIGHKYIIERWQGAFFIATYIIYLFYVLYMSII